LITDNLLYLLDQFFVQGLINVLDVLQYIVGISTAEQGRGNARVETGRELDGKLVNGIALLFAIGGCFGAGIFQVFTGWMPVWGTPL